MSVSRRKIGTGLEENVNVPRRVCLVLIDASLIEVAFTQVGIIPRRQGQP